MSRSLVALASLVVMALSFAATLWVVRSLTATGPPPHGLPGFERSTPQIPAPSGPPAAAVRSRSAPAAPPFPRRAPPAAAQEGRSAGDPVSAAAVAAETAEEAARAEVTAPVESADESLDVRVDLYRDALQRSLEASGDAAMLAHRAVWAEHFLRIDAVQEELASLPSGARESALARIRQQMGYDDAEIARMAEIDAVRDERWAVGLAYMQERRRLESTFEGDALDEELRHLREQVFAHEAKTIEREEESGFYRFERPRIYGRN